jgi:hypothetical protein
LKRIYFDTEFTGLHQNTTLISIGIVDDDNNAFYSELTDFDKSQVDKWLQDNVIDNLIMEDYNDGEVDFDKEMNVTYVKGKKEFVAEQLRAWLEKIAGEDKLEVWSDCLAYDWMLFNNLFGTAFDIPEQIYYIPMDICTGFRLKGIDPDISREDFAGKLVGEDGENPFTRAKTELKHNSLWDAYVIKAACRKLGV